MATNIENAATVLQTLAQYEIDGSFLIGQAIDNIDNQAIRDKLLTMRQECENNIKELSTVIRDYGRQVPTHSRDFKGFFMQGYSAMRGMLSDQGVMKALYTNSQIIMKAYDNALSSDDLPNDVKDRIRKKIYDIKKKHMDYISSQI